MSKQKETQKNNYFEYRKEDLTIYENYRIPKWIEQQLKKESKILDYGCGFGQNLAALRDAKYDIYGVDIERTALAHCLEKHLDVKLLDLDNLENPFEFKFDTILISHVIEHMPRNQIIDTLTLIKEKFLNDGGELLVAVPNAQSNTGSYWMYEDWTHTTLFTSGSIYYVLKAAGFNNIEFLDVDCTLGSFRLRTYIRKMLFKMYKINKAFWNKVTGSQYHNPSPQIFSFEIKVKAN